MKKLLYIFFITIFYTSAFSQEDYWDKLNGPFGGRVTDMVMNAEGKLFAIADLEWPYLSGLFRSIDGGTTWNLIMQSSYTLLSLAFSPSGELYLGTYHDEIYRSPDDGTTWEHLGSELSPSQFFCFAFTTEGLIFAGTSEGLYRSADNGISWVRVSQNWYPYDFYVREIIIHSNGNIVAGTNENLYFSSDNGDNWKQAHEKLNLFCLIEDNEGRLFAGVNTYGSIRGGVFFSTDSGQTWNPTDTLLRRTEIRSLAIDNNGSLIIGTYGHGILKSDDLGASWIELYNFPGSWYVSDFIVRAGNGILAATNHGIYSTKDNGLSWKPSSDGLVPLSVRFLEEGNDGTLYAGLEEYGIYRSTDRGVTWLPKPNDIQFFSITALKNIPGRGIYAATENFGLYCSTDNGENWVPADSGLESNEITEIIPAPNDNIYVKTKYNLFYKSVDGRNWIVDTLANIEESLFAIHKDGHIFTSDHRQLLRSDNYGISWEELPFRQNSRITFLLISDTGEIFVIVDNNNIYRSNDLGETWVEQYISSEWYIAHIAAVDKLGNLFISNGYTVVRLNSEDGTWIILNSGLTDKNVYSFSFSNENFIYAATTTGIFRSQNPVTQVKEINDLSPYSYNLSQNYPNPFNPTTNFEFRVSDYGFVKLQVYDLLGKELAVIVNEEMPAGNYSYIWNAGNLASGVYFYKLQAGDFIDVKKLILLK